MKALLSKETKLTPQDIQFIDTYLKNSDYPYIDLRMELTDHIATAVEQKMQEESLDFYNAFKNYMLIHRCGILKRSTKWHNSYEWTALKEFGMFLLRPYMLALGLLLFFFFQNTSFNSYFSKSFSLGNFIYVAMIIPSIFWIVYRYHIRKTTGHRFWVLERLGLLFIFYFYFFPRIYLDEKASGIMLTLSALIFIGYIVYAVKAVRQFNKVKKQFAL